MDTSWQSQKKIAVVTSHTQTLCAFLLHNFLFSSSQVKCQANNRQFINIFIFNNEFLASLSCISFFSVVLFLLNSFKKLYGLDFV